MVVTSLEHLPLAIVALHGEVTADDIEALRAYYRDLHARGSRFATIVDARHVHLPNARIRRALSDMGNEFAGDDERNTVRVALLLDSAVLVGVFRALQWFLRLKVPMRSFATAPEAYGWVLEGFQAEGLVPAATTKNAIAALDA